MDAFHLLFFLLGLLIAFGGWRLYSGLTRLLRFLFGDVIVGPAIFVVAGLVLAARLRTIEMSATHIAVAMLICAALAVGIRFAVRDRYIMLFLSGGLALVFIGWLLVFPHRPRELLDLFVATSLDDFYRSIRVAVTPSGLDLLVALFGGIAALALRRVSVVFITALAGAAMVGFGRHSLVLALAVFAVSVVHQYFVLEYSSNALWEAAAAAEKKQTGVW